MVASGPAGDAQVLNAYKHYDRTVDVVSVFHWLYTKTENLPDTVEWFDRYPKLTHDDGRPATPDFAVRFRDGTGIVGEVAALALHEASVESLCRQLLRYDQLDVLTTSTGEMSAVSRLDVLLLVPMEVGTDAVRRIIQERMADGGHWFKPALPPCIVQFAYTDGKYVLQRMPHDGNGQLDSDVRDPALGSWLEASSLKISISDFRDNKAQYAFCNDPIDPLYLAVHLWQHLFNTIAVIRPGLGYTPLDLTTSDIRGKLRELYGHGRTADVRKAMQLLARAGCAQGGERETWKIAWGPIRLRSGEADLADALASRAFDSSYRAGPIQRRLRDERSSPLVMGERSLFDAADEMHAPVPEDHDGEGDSGEE